MSFSLETSTQKLSAYLNSYNTGQYISSNPEQREFTKSLKWKSNLIFFIMWSGEIPGKIYYHPKTHENGSVYYASLDGKGRTSAAQEFMNNQFKLENKFEVPGLERLYGKLFNQFEEADKSRFLSAKVSIVEASRTMTEYEYTIFFQLIKTPSDCKTGESLHSDTSSPIRKMLDDKMLTNPEFKKFINDVWKKDQHFTHYTVIAKCISYRHFGSNKVISPSDLQKLWNVGVTQGVFDEVITNMLKVWKLKNDGLKIDRLQSESVFCPFFMLYNEDTRENDIEKIKAKWDEKVQFGKPVGGSHAASYSRYLELKKMIM
jgi:hypothetical protein